jgi:uncharacterized protein
MATVLTPRRRTLVWVWMLCLLVAGAARAQELPTLTQPVNDFANVIDAGSEAELDRRIRALQQTTGDVVVVATVDTIAPYGTIEEYAVRLFERAGIGQKGQDNGLLIVVAVKDRRVRIEVGYELEQFITDGYAGDTIRQMLLPAFRDGRYGQGLVAGTTRIIRRIGEGRGREIPEVAPPPATTRRAERDAFPWFPIIVVAIVILLRIMRIGGGPPGMHRRRRRRTWSGWSTGVGGFGGGWMGGGFGGGGFGGGGGGGFGGFGGGRSGGGGASGGW